MNKIKEIRKLKSVSVTTLAEKLQMSQSNLTKIENGKIELKPAIAQKIADILGVGVNALFEQNACIIGQNSISCRLINPETWNLPPYSSISIAEHMLPHNSKNIELYIQEDDTMMPLLPNGGLALINTEIVKFTKNGLYLLEYHHQLMLRRLQKKDEDKYICLTENKSYSSEILSKNEIEIKGECIGSIISQLY